MKILIVCSGNEENFDFKIHQAFIYEQIEAVKRKYNLDYDVFLVKGKGFGGYFKGYFKLKKKIKEANYDLLHSHNGLCNLISVLQRKIPVLTTFHGSDINNSKVNIISSVASLLAERSIFVTDRLYDKIFLKTENKFCVIPCGIDVDQFYSIHKKNARAKLGFNEDKKYIMFASSFRNPVKNYQLAKSAIDLLDEKIEIIELKNRTREEVNLLLNACDLLLMTSLSEGSPQIIKEAMACNCPIVATDVGDIREIIGNTEGCYISSFAPQDVAEKIMAAIEFVKTKGRTNSREKIRRFDNQIIAEKVFKVYQQANQENH